jgi:N-acetyl sugar amidotransferase
LLQKIKKASKNGKYDCLIGVSGGVDSSFVAHLVKSYGLKPLAVHLDNGWNSELATSNVENLLKKLDIDLYTEVLDWSEFRDIQKSFLKSSTSNIEIPTDHAIWATLARVAAQYKIKYIFAGNNVVTESIMPDSWLYGSKDFKFINSIHKKFGEIPMKSYPKLTIINYIYFFIFLRIRWVPILNYISFNKSEAKELLMNDYGWRDYGGKHYESIFTRFFHAYYLPKKFNYDLRKSYNSALICSGQISRDEALQDLENQPAKSEILIQDKEYVMKKLGFSESQFTEIINRPNRSQKDYPNNEYIWTKLSGLVSFARDWITRVN